MISHDSRNSLAVPVGKVPTRLPNPHTFIFLQQLISRKILGRDFPLNETEMVLVSKKDYTAAITASWGGLLDQLETF